MKSLYKYMFSYTIFLLFSTSEDTQKLSVLLKWLEFISMASVMALLMAPHSLQRQVK